MAASAAMGMKEICLTAHHEGGFALWPSNYTECVRACVRVCIRACVPPSWLTGWPLVSCPATHVLNLFSACCLTMFCVSAPHSTSPQPGLPPVPLSPALDTTPLQGHYAFALNNTRSTYTLSNRLPSPSSPPGQLLRGCLQLAWGQGRCPARVC